MKRFLTYKKYSREQYSQFVSKKLKKEEREREKKEEIFKTH